MYCENVKAQSDSSDQDFAKCMVTNGLHFMGIPYQAGTLESDGLEKLIFHSDKFDCVTFVEYVLTLSIYQSKKDGFKGKSFEQILTQIRYLDSKIDGYGSRLHYFTHWINQQEKSGILLDITQSLGGIKLNKTINFMSRNAQKYPKLKSSNERTKILAAENVINSQVTYYIPKEKVASIEHLICDGDIIAMTSSIDGLDVAHTGIAIMQKGRLHLLHASEKEKKVVVSIKTLHDYLADNKSQTGIIVMRGTL